MFRRAWVVFFFCTSSLLKRRRKHIPCCVYVCYIFIYDDGRHEKDAKLLLLLYANTTYTQHRKKNLLYITSCISHRNAGEEHPRHNINKISLEFSYIFFFKTFSSFCLNIYICVCVCYKKKKKLCLMFYAS